MIKIIDIIQHKNQYSTQTMIVIDGQISLKYERVGDILIGEDSGFFNFLKYERPSKNSQAFAGREFDIPLKNGEIEKACGQWWSFFPEDYSGLVYGVGAASVKELEDCYVFSSKLVDKEIVDDWLEKNKPSNNYNLYNKRNKDFGERVIVSRW